MCIFRHVEPPLPPSAPPRPAGQDRVSEFELKLMDITSENLGIPDTEYAATVRCARRALARAGVGRVHRAAHGLARQECAMLRVFAEGQSWWKEAFGTQLAFAGAAPISHANLGL